MATSAREMRMVKGGGQLVALLRVSLHASRSSSLLIRLQSGSSFVFFCNSGRCSKRKRRLRSKHCTEWNWAKPSFSHQSGCLNANVMFCCCVSWGSHHTDNDFHNYIKNASCKTGIEASTLISEFRLIKEFWLKKMKSECLKPPQEVASQKKSTVWNRKLKHWSLEEGSRNKIITLQLKLPYNWQCMLHPNTWRKVLLFNRIIDY